MTAHAPADRVALHKERDRIGQRGLWVASCATCGYPLRVSLRQQTAELGRYHRCPVCGIRAAHRRRPARHRAAAPDPVMDAHAHRAARRLR